MNGMKNISIVSFEDLWRELMRMKAAGVKAYVGCCCQPFFTKHVDDFEKAGLPGILLDIDNTTCYELDQAKEAYAGRFESQTNVSRVPFGYDARLSKQVDASPASPFYGRHLVTDDEAGECLLKLVRQNRTNQVGPCQEVLRC